MTTIVFAFIATYFIELLYRRIILGKQIKIELKKFDSNRDYIMKIDFYGYKLGTGHLYDNKN